MTLCSYGCPSFAATLALAMKRSANFLLCVRQWETWKKGLMDYTNVTYFFGGSQIQVIGYWDLPGLSILCLWLEREVSLPVCRHTKKVSS